MFLAVLSLERVYAVFWPLRHRVTSTRRYIFSIVIVWAVGLCTTGLFLLRAYHADVDTVYAVATGNLLVISLVIICASYLCIRSRCTLQNQTYKTAKENQRETRICVFQRHST